MLKPGQADLSNPEKATEEKGATLLDVGMNIRILAICGMWE